MGCCLASNSMPIPSVPDKQVTVNPGQFIVHKDREMKQDYEVIRTLGQGSFGRVYMVRRKNTGQERAAKEIIKRGNVDNERLLTEVKALASIDHPNILKIYELYEDSEKFSIVSEYLTGGELFDYIMHSTQGVTESIAAHLIMQLLSAISLSHHSSIIHRDLKPENILLEQPPLPGRAPLVKIIDFGTSALIDSIPLTARATSRYYTAPEVLQGNYTKACDVWSLGVILYILLCGYPPFNGNSDVEIKQKIAEGKADLIHGVWERISDDAKGLIETMLMPAEERVTADQALMSPWLKKHDEGSNGEESEAGETLNNFRKFKGELELRRILCSYVISQFSTQEDLQPLRANFQSLDKDHSGMLTRSELLAGLSQSMPLEEAEYEVESIFNEVDVNKTGTVDYSEFLTAASFARKKVKVEKLRAAFESLDLDKNGKITKNELESLLGNGVSASTNWKRLISEADLDSDGELSLSEFISLLLSEQ